MLCTKCGTNIDANENFCKNCGNSVENQQFQNNQQFVNSQANSNYIQQPVVNNAQQTFGNNQNSNLNSNGGQNVVDPSKKKFAILSIIIPIVAIIWYMFIGLSFFLAIVIAAAGFNCSIKGEAADKKLAKIGKIANGIFVGIAIVTFILQLIIAFNI